MTQEDLAAKCDVSRQAVAKWESGESFPDITKIVQIADYFEISLDELIRGEDREEDQKSSARKIFKLFVENIESLRKKITFIFGLYSDREKVFQLRVLIRKARLVFPKKMIEELLELTTDFSIGIDDVVKKYGFEWTDAKRSENERLKVAESITADIYKKGEALLAEYLDLP